MMRILTYIILALVALVGIGIGIVDHFISNTHLTFGGAPGNPRSKGITQEEKQKMNQNTMEQLQAGLAFVCKHEEKPELSAETQQLYNYALYHDLHNMWTGKRGDAVWNGLARYYRIAALNGDYKANIRLQYLLKSGRISSDMPQTEVHNLNEELAQQLPATAYYNLYGYLDVGYGVRTEKDGKYAYLRKAADLGSREAQYVVGDILTDINDEETRSLRLKIYEQLLSCSSEQGLGKASDMLGIRLQRKQEYQQALEVFHQGVKNGESQSALQLSNGFSEKTGPDDKLYFLNLQPDSERSRRYKVIWDYLSGKDYLQPKVPDLDDIVPLPPAPLPEWDGKIAFQRWFEGDAPPKPSEALMMKLANQAGVRVDNGLDLETGLPKKPKK
ncbi:sel1 repeat family protein [Rodentibacter caecimuris]|uniref:SEL1-like repeat protein n=3 Tax=Rodentibacter caecimuris TaxID=1796644 RepID=UPI003AADEA93